MFKEPTTNPTIHMALPVFPLQRSEATSQVKSSWGSLWGESGFLRVQRGQGLCGLGAYISVALCRPYSGSRPLPRANTAPPPGLPEQGVFLGQTTFLTSPLAAQVARRWKEVARRWPGGGRRWQEVARKSW